MSKVPKLKTIGTMVARDMGDGYIKIAVIIDTKLYEYRVRKAIAISMITSLAQSLDDSLHTM